MAKPRFSRLIIPAAVLVAGGVAVFVLAPSVQTLRNALPVLRHAHVGWVIGAGACQFLMYAALANVLRAGLSSSRADTKEPAPLHLPFFFLWTAGAAFLWACRALPGPALAGLATLTFLLNRRGVKGASAQAVAATFFLSDYVSFFALGVLLFSVLALERRLNGLHPALLGIGMAIIAVGLIGAFFALRVPDAAGRTAQKVAEVAARLLRRTNDIQKKWGQSAQNGVRLFYDRWQDITARRRTLFLAFAWAGLMHGCDAATVFCAGRAFGGGTGDISGLALASGAGYVAGNLAAIVSFLPAGLGFFEGAMGATLHFVGGLTPEQAALATLLYRVLSVWLPLPFALGVARHAISAARKNDHPA